MNQARASLLAQEIAFRGSIKAANMLGEKLPIIRTPPKIRDVNTLADWIADHPAAKSSRSLRLVQEAYYESLGVKY